MLHIKRSVILSEVRRSQKVGKAVFPPRPPLHPATPLPGNLSITVLLSPLCSLVPKVRKAECLPMPLSLRNRWPATLGCSHAASSCQSRSPGAQGPAREAQGHSALGWLQQFLSPFSRTGGSPCSFSAATGQSATAAGLQQELDSPAALEARV